jgi:hypothetical protein
MTREKGLSFPTLGRITVEIAVLVFSILLALGLESAWSDRADRREEQRLLAGLETEFGEYLTGFAELEDLAAFHDSLLAATAELLEVTSGSEVATPRADTLLFRLVFVPIFERGGGVYASILDAQKLGLIRDEELRAGLTIWYEQAEELQDVDRLMRSYVFETILPLYDRHRVPLARPIVAAQRPDWPVPVMAEPQATPRYQALFADVAFENVVTWRRTWSIYQGNLTDSLRSQTERVLGSIQRARSRS